MRTTIYVFILVFGLFAKASAQSAGEQPWVWQYPKPQGNTLRDICNLGRDTAVAAGEVGTVVKTTDGGTHWDVQHHAGGTPLDLHGVYFTDAMHGWAVGGVEYPSRNVIIRTEDGGSHWTEVPTDTSLCYNTVYFVDADTGFVAGEDGILLRTTDGGRSWDIRKIDDYIGMGWLDVYELYAFSFTDKQTGWLVGLGYYGNQIYKTTDCGRSWTWNELSVQPKIFYAFKDVSFPDRNHGFMVGTGGSFVKTTDGGATWQSQNLSTRYQIQKYYYLFSLCFGDSLTGWITGENYLLKTTDAGENWVEEDNIGNGLDGLLKVRFSAGNEGWLVGYQGMTLHTTDRGGSWTLEREARHTFSAVHFLDEQTGRAVGDSGTIVHTTDGGDSWLKQHGPDSTRLVSVYAPDQSHVLAVGGVIEGGFVQKAVMLRTTDSGLTWNSQTVDSIVIFNSVFFSSDSTGWISASGGMVLKTTDVGRTWIVALTDSSVGHFAASGKVQFVIPSTGWIGCNLRTTDGGLHWERLTPPLTLPSVSFVNRDLGWVVGGSTGQTNIYRTIDGGTTWQPLGMTYSGYNFTVRFVNETTGWISGVTATPSQIQESILKTTDGGTTWQPQESPLRTLNDIFFVNPTTGWAVGDGIIKTANGGGVDGIRDPGVTLQQLPGQITLLQNYPNPFNGTTVIRYHLPRSGLVSLKVYDILGRVVRNLVERWESKGDHAVVLEANSLSSGVYFYRLKSDSYSTTKAMTLIR